MTCPSELTHSMYADGELPAREAMRLERHAMTCGACRARIEALRDEDQVLRMALKDADAIVICVPTPLGKSRQPDISYIEKATEDVCRVLRPGQLVVLESTTYPGTTQEILRSRLEAIGLVAGEDFFLAFSPERIDPANGSYHLENIAKIVGGVTPACLDLASTLSAALEAQPDTKQVFVVSGVGAFDRLYEEIFTEQRAAFADRVTFHSLAGLSIVDLEQRVRHLPDGAIVGSAIVRLVERLADDPALVAKVGEFVGALKDATRAAVAGNGAAAG